MPRPVSTFARFVVTPENRSAWHAVRHMADRLISAQAAGDPSPLLLHGPPGVGKSHLIQALIAEVTHRCPRLAVTSMPASDLLHEQAPELFESGEESGDINEVAALNQARHSDLWVVEDLQHLDRRLTEAFVQVIDYLSARGRPMVFSADCGPQRLARRGQRYSARFGSRLAAGLVVGIDPLGPDSRLALLQALAQRRQLAVPTPALRWLADNLGAGGRQLEGAIQRLEGLAKMQRKPLDLDTVQSHFHEQADAGRPTVERIAQHISGHFRLTPRDLQSARRHRDVLLPRQISMYLARRLTDLSLEQIGAYFGGRDHATVLHACRKVEEAIGNDPALCGTIRELHAAFA